MEGRRGRRFGRARLRHSTLLPLRSAPLLSNTLSCWYCDFKSSVLNEPIFHFGRRHAGFLRFWFSIGIGFSLAALFGVTVIFLTELVAALHLHGGSTRLRNILRGSFFGFYHWVFGWSFSAADVGYLCISSAISAYTHELGHALAAASEGVQIEYIAIFLAVLFPGALVAFNHELLQSLSRVATLRIYCAGVWHNAALCAVSAWTLFLLPSILYPFYVHGVSPMVLDVSSTSPLSGYLSPGDSIVSVDGKQIQTAEDWMETMTLLDKQKLQNSTYFVGRRGYCVPNSLTGDANRIDFVNSQNICTDQLTPFATISCFDSNLLDDAGKDDYHAMKSEHMYCLNVTNILSLQKCGAAWEVASENKSTCFCSEEESCVAPVQSAGQLWVEITYSSAYSFACQEIGENLPSNDTGSDIGKNSCGGTFVFIGDAMSMARSISLTSYQPRWLFPFGGYLPNILEKLLIYTFHVSLVLALLNSLPVYYLDGESILEVSLCYFSLLTPRQRRALLQFVIAGGTVISILLSLKIFFVLLF